jgi:flagellin
MSNITLSAGVRQNLLALQQTSTQTATVNEALATGKKVNSALDNPSSYFTSQSLSNRASDLGTLLDSIGQAVQTLNAADQGITSLTSLVQSAKSIATQAEQSTKGSVNYTNVTGSATIAADRSRVTGPTSVATGDTASTASVKGTYTINTSAFASPATGDTLALTDGTTTVTFEYLTAGATASGGETGFTNGTALQAAIATAFTGATVSGAGTSITIQAALTQDYTTNYSAVGSTSLVAGGIDGETSATNGSLLTVSDGTNTATFRYVASGASATVGTFTNSTTLAAAIAASAVATDVTASSVSVGGTAGYLQLDAAKTVSITTGGALSTAYGFGTSATTDNYNATLAGLTGSLTVQVGSDITNTLTFGSGNGQISTGTQLTAALGTITDITSSINSSNHINFAPQSSAAVTVDGSATVLSAFGLSNSTTTPTSSVATANATRTNLQDQYNNLLTQIDQLAGDSSYNGVNLLNGDNLKVTFNETDTSSLTIAGVKLNSAGLGLTAISGTGFQDNNNIDNTVTSLNTALDTLRSQASTFGSNLTTVQTRQDFTNNLISTLQTGSDNLILADTNQEGADLLALQTRQQLSTTALSISSQADQAILKIL